MSFEITKEMALDLIVMTLKSNAPKKTGNLSQNAIVKIKDGVSVGGKVAPYAQKTEEINRSSKGWIKSTVQMLQPTLQSFFENNLSNEDITEMTRSQSLSFDRQFDYLADIKEKGSV